MQIPLLSLGLFVFSAGQTAIDEIQRRTAMRFGTGQAVGVLPKQQPLGPDANTITLPGLLYPGITDGLPAMDELRDMMATGKCYALLDGTGHHLGFYVINSLEENLSNLALDGNPQKIAFTLSLTQVDPQSGEQVATLSRQADQPQAKAKTVAKPAKKPNGKAKAKPAARPTGKTAATKAAQLKKRK